MIILGAGPIAIEDSGDGRPRVTIQKRGEEQPTKLEGEKQQVVGNAKGGDGQIDVDV